MPDAIILPVVSMGVGCCGVTGGAAVARFSLQSRRMMIGLWVLLSFFTLAFALNTSAQTISTFAGTGTLGYTGDGGPATAAQIFYPWGVAADRTGNLFISSWLSSVTSYNRIRKVDVTGNITSYAGNGAAGFSGDGGPASVAQLYNPNGVAVDSAGNLYICDYGNNRIRKVNTSGIITTIAGTGPLGTSGDGGPATSAQLYSPCAVASDIYGNIYIGQGQYRLRKVDTAGMITTIAGTGTSGFSGDGGPATAAQIGSVYGISADAAGNVYFADYNAHRIRKISSAGIITTVAGNGGTGWGGDGGPATAAPMYPMFVTVDAAGNVNLSDYTNNRVRRVNAAGVIATVAGTGAYGFSGDAGPATAAKLNYIYGLTNDPAGNIYVCDYLNYRIRKVYNYNRRPSFTSGASQTLSVCQNAAADSINALLPVMDSDLYQPITWSVLAAGSHGTAAGSFSTAATGSVVAPHGLYYTPAAGYSGLDTFKILVSDGFSYDTLSVYVTINPLPAAITGGSSIPTGGYAALRSTTSGGTWSSSNATVAPIGSLNGVMTGTTVGNAVVSYTLSTTGCVITLPIAVYPYAGRIITTIAGTGTAGFSGDGSAATGAKINHPWGVAADAAGNIYVADYNNNRIRKISTTGTISTVVGTGAAGFSGDGGLALSAKINAPYDVAVDGAGNLYIADNGNNRIRKVSSTGTITTIAGTGASGYGGDGGPATAAVFTGPSCLAFDGAGNLYISVDGTRIRIINASGIINTFAGNGTSGYSGDGGPATAAQLNNPVSVTADNAGNVYIADQLNNYIRKVSPSGIIATVAGTGAPAFGGDGGPATAAAINNPWGIATDYFNNIFVGDQANNRIRKISLAGIMSTLAGNGTASSGGDACAATSGQLNQPGGICLDGSGNIIIADMAGNRIRKVTYNHAPYFNGGRNQSMVVCQNGGDSINSILSITDIDPAQNETWTVVASPLHGSVSATYTATSNGSSLIPVGLYYNPALGYTGLDSFKVVVADCGIGTDTTMVHVTVSPPPAAIVGASTVCPLLTTLFTDAVGSGTWSSSNSAVATVGSSTGLVTGVASGVATITYSPGAGCIATKVITVSPAPAAITGLSYVCVGQSTTYIDGTPGGVWSSLSSLVTVGSSSALTTGLSAGIAAVTYTQSGCITVKSISINPSPSAIAGSLSVCVGAGIPLSCSGGGVWSSSAPGLASVDSITGFVTGVSTGNPTIDYTLPGGCAAYYVLTVQPLPAPISGPSVICYPGTVLMTDATSGGFWSSGLFTTNAIVDPATGMVTGLATGVSTISYTSAIGCSVTKDVTVSPIPAPISGGDSVCVGATIALSHTGSGIWSSSNPSLASVGSLSGVVSGLVSGGGVTISYTEAGCAATIGFTVNPLPLPIVGPSSLCLGFSDVLTDAAPSGIWLSGSPAIVPVGATTGAMSGLALGTAIITYRLPTGCQTTKIVSVTPAPGAITGVISLCAGGTTTLANSLSGGVWSTSNPGVATVGAATGVVTGAGPGTCVISYSMGSGCIVTVLVTVNPLPALITGTFAVCAGSTTSLSDATPGGIWSSSNAAVASVVGSTGVVTGVAAGTASIVYTLSITGCSISSVVSVNALPAAIAGPSSVCQSASIALTNATAGGAWSSSLPTVATVGATGTVTGVATGVTTINYTTPAGCSRSLLVTVNPLPSTISGPSALCVGASVSLTSSGGGTWSSGSTGVLVGSVTGSVTGVSAGTAIITYSLSTACFTTSTITVNPLPLAISGPSALCMGASATLLSSGIGTWLSSAPGIATIGSGSGLVNGIATGTTTIDYTLPTGCSTSRTITVTAAPAAIAGPSSVCAGGTVVLSNAVPGGLWTSSNTSAAVVGSLSGIVTGLGPGLSTVITYSLGSGCTVVKSLTVSPSPSSVSGTADICVGGISLMACSTPGGVWSSSATAIGSVSTTGLVTGAAVGTCTISYSVSGCAATIVVTVHPLPGTITGPLSVCVGSTTTLSNTVSGGTWSSSSSLIGVGTSSGVVIGLSSGTATISYTIAAGCAVWGLVTVYPVPSPIGGASQLCIGSSITLSDATPGGTWASANPSIATVTGGGLVTGFAAGVVQISYTVSGCSATKTITVNAAPPSITGPGTICTGLLAAYTNTASGGVWSSSNIISAPIGSASGIVTAGIPGIATITYTISGGCSASISVSVVAGPAAITGGPNVCLGHTLTLTDPTPGGTWSSSNIAVAGIAPATGIVSGIGSGSATVSYSIAGCIATTTVSVNPPPAAISGSANLCLLASAPLSNSVSGGVWTSGNSFIASVNPVSGVVSGVSVGVTVISYTTGPGCVATLPVTIIPTPAAISGPSAICLGASATLTDATSGGSWSIANPALATINSSGIITTYGGGVDTVFYTMPLTGCRAALPLSIIVLPAITAPSTLCAWGDTVTVSNTYAGGIFTSSLVTVLNLGGGLGTVTTSAPGVASVTYLIPAGCSVSKTLTINPLPAPISGTNHLCAGHTAVFSNASPGGIWTSSNTIVASAGSGTGVIAGLTSGIAHIIYRLPTGCKSDTLVYVSLPPGAIIGDTVLCEASTTTLSNAVLGGVWASSNPLVAAVGSSSGVVSGIGSGVATITYATGAACFAVKVITVNSIPGSFTVSGGGSYCTGGSGLNIFLSGSQIGVNYQLFNGTSPVGTSVAGSGTLLDFGVTPFVGTYSVRGTSVAYGCTVTMSGTAIVNSIAPPSVYTVTGGGSYCAGGSGVPIGLSNSDTGVSYQLYAGLTPSGLSVSGTGGLLDFGLHTLAGVYTVVGTTVAASCVSDMSGSAVVSITAALAASVAISVAPDDTVCNGSNISLTPLPVNGGLAPAYQWLVNGVNVATGPTYTYIPSNGDVVNLIMSGSAVCALPSVVSHSISLTVLDSLVPIVVVTVSPGSTIVTGQSVTFSASATNAGSTPAYQWFVNGAPLSGATLSTYTGSGFLSGDLVACIVTSSGICGGYSAAAEVAMTINDKVGTNSLNTPPVLWSITPNPSSGDFSVDGQINSNIDLPVSLEITNLLGQVLLMSDFHTIGPRVKKHICLDKTIAGGAYILTIHTPAETIRLHLLIQN